jgi:N-methylhydantoinase B
MNGGGCGRTGSVVFNPGKADERDVGKVTVLELKPGDTLHMVTPTGGGFGDPFAREAERVRLDVVEAFITPAKALEDYGVAVVDGKVDVAATEAARDRRANIHGSEAFAFGAKRAEIEAKWPGDARSALAKAVRRVPATLRHQAKADLALRVEKRGGTITPEMVREEARALFPA